jgi:glycerol-3-phosphate dehydrogenase
MADYDLAIIGGGINGAGLARDAAGRGARVLLVEQNDLASGTSSASTKLIHGGLRYLEHGALLLVREALAEREVLLRMAPHIIHPMRFVLPAVPGPRSPFMLRLGLWLYDTLGARKLLPSAVPIDLATHAAGVSLKRRYRAGFEYSDCAVDDARLVVLNAVDAGERGATIRTRTRLVRAEREREWQLVLNAQGRRETATARVLVNAAGPWAGIVAETVLRLPGKPPIRLVKGSHIVVRRLFDHDCGYIFQLPERRIVFALPFAGDFTLIGTTNEDFSGSLEAAAPSGDEVMFLCRTASEFFREQIAPEHVIWAFAGVRSLHDDGAGRPEDVTRDYHLMLDERSGAAPLLTIYGGKITTYRRLAEAALRKLGQIMSLRGPWTATAPLPGGDFLRERTETLVAQAQRSWPFLDEPNTFRLVRAYGTRLYRIFGKRASREEAGPWFGPLSAAEIRYLMTQEWARNAQDVLWRRSKLGLRLSAMDQEGLARFMASEAGTDPSVKTPP